MTENEHIDILAAKVLAGEASEQESNELASWIAASVENRSYFESLEKIYKQSVVAVKLRATDADAAWAKVQAQLHLKPVLKPVLPVYAKIAAMLIIAAGLGIIALNLFREKTIQLAYQTSNISSEFILPDSTRVMLNKNSKIDIEYSENSRKVMLSGEAFFEISGDPDRQFEVIISGLTIRDIGTSFNVKSHGKDSVIVVVTDGSIQMFDNTGASLELQKGEAGTYLAKSNEFYKLSEADTNILSYKTKIFVFENASLPVVISKLMEVYDISIELSENIVNCHITAAFKDEQPAEIINVIAETLELEVKINNGIYLLDGKSCEE